jgi:hypothetical protein
LGILLSANGGRSSGAAINGPVRVGAADEVAEASSLGSSEGETEIAFWHFGHLIVKGRDGSLTVSNCKRVEHFGQEMIIGVPKKQ